jgi:hypothetical protein
MLTPREQLLHSAQQADDLAELLEQAVRLAEPADLAAPGVMARTQQRITRERHAATRLRQLAELA